MFKKHKYDHDDGKQKWVALMITIEVCGMNIICLYNFDLKEANLSHTLVWVL